MFKKTGETKEHGSIRKNKVYGAIGVLIFGIIAMFSSHEGVVADEIKATKTTALAPVAEASDTSLIVQAKTVAAEVAEAKSLAASSAPVPVSMVAAGNPAEGQPNVTVENQELKDAIATAQASNIEVKQKPTEIIGTANTQEEAANLEADAIAREKEQAQSIRESTDKYNSDYATAQSNTQKPGYLSEVVTQGLNFQSEPNASLSISGTTEFGQQDAPRAYSYEEYIGSGRTFANNPIAAYKTSASGNFVIPKINKGQTITATYTNLQNSSYNGTKIAKVVYEVTNLNNGIGIIGFAEKDPTKGIYTFYNLTAPSKYGVKIRFYDENDNIIQFKQATPAILALTSLSKTIRADGKKHEEGIADYNFKPVKITGSYVEKQSDNRLAASSPTQNIPDRYNHPDFYKTSIAGVIDNGDVISFTMRRDSEFDSGYWLAITSRLPSPFILTKPDLSYNFFSYNTAGTVLLDNYIQGTTTKLTETQIIKPKGTPTGESYVASHEERVHFNGKVYKYVSSSENAMGTVRLGITNVYNYYVEAIGGARVVYLDDDDNKKILETKELMGYYGQTDTYRTTATLQYYQNLHYEVVSDNYPSVGVTYDETIQTFEVHLRHKTVPVEETKTVTETIQYVYEDASQAAESKVQTLEFKRTNTKDLVAGRVIQEGVWSPSESTFPAVTSPVIAGYTADHPTVDAVANISATSNDVERKVTYKANAQKLTYTVIDETDSRTLADQVLLETGVSKGAVPTQAQTRYDQVVAGYQAQGYELVSQEALPTQFDTDDATDQNVTVRLRHKTVPVEETKTVTETIQYVYENGDQAAPAKVQKLDFKRTNIKDLVTGKTPQEGVWTPSIGTFPEVVSPTVDGYTPDKAKVDAVTVTPEQGNINVTVTYKADKQKVTYTIIDDTAQKTLKNKELLASGNSDTPLPNSAREKYDLIVNAYLAQGYELVSKDQLPAKFDLDSSYNQNVVVHVKHGTTDSQESKDVNLTIRYHGAGSQTPADQVQTATWTRSVKTDKVTGNQVSATAWTSDKTNYDAVPSPVIPGYTVDVAAVPSEAVTQENIVKDVYYTIQTQKVTYTVVDETTGQTLENQVELTTGESGAALPAAAQTKYDTVVAGYLAKGYEVVSQDALPGQFDTDSSVDQNVVIRLKHGTTESQESKDVNLTVRYHGAGGQTPADQVQTATWTRTVTTDKVTGQPVSATAWTSDKANYNAVPSPVIPGYSVDIDTVPSEVVTQENIVKDVHYSAVPTTPEVPDTPVKPEPPVTPLAPTQPKAQTTPAPVLPRTGEDTENAKVMTAAGIGALLTLIGIGTRRKKED